jgi:hypothetical protein
MAAFRYRDTWEIHTLFPRADYPETVAALKAQAQGSAFGATIVRCQKLRESEWILPWPQHVIVMKAHRFTV